MIQTITPDIRNKLEEIGFEEDEISTIRIIHELKKRAHPIDVKKLINQAAFKNMAKGISETFEKNSWDEEDFFEIVEKCRRDKRKK